MPQSFRYLSFHKRLLIEKYRDNNPDNPHMFTVPTFVEIQNFNRNLKSPKALELSANQVTKPAGIPMLKCGFSMVLIDPYCQKC